VELVSDNLQDMVLLCHMQEPVQVRLHTQETPI